MKAFLVVNAFLKSASFEKLYGSLTAAFSFHGKELSVVTNAEAVYKIPEKAEKGDLVLFFDKDVRLAEILETRGYRLINSAYTIETCDDKAKTYTALIKNGINAMPETILAPMTFSNVGYTDYSFLDYAQNKLGYPMIVKENVGSFGMQVYLVNNREQLESAAKKLAPKAFLMQKFIKKSRGKDLRVYVVGNKVRACALRENKNDFRSNYALGGTMTAFSPDEKYLSLALMACRAVRADFAGVDILFGDEPLVCEINSNAHFDGISKACNIDIADLIAEYCLNLL